MSEKLEEFLMLLTEVMSESPTKAMEYLKKALEEERKNYVKVFCHTCGGKGYLTETRWPDEDEVKVVCWECGGRGWVYAKLAEEKVGDD